MQKQWELIKEFSLPGELSLSITYLQRALRDCVFQHQRPKVKQYMLELEREMLSIGQEQEGLVRQLSERVKRFQMTVQSQHLVTLSDDLLYGFVTRQLATQHETAVISTAPKHISQRWSATELAQKYSLETILGTAVVKKEEFKSEPLDPHEQQTDDDDDADDDDDKESRWNPVMSISAAKRYKKQAKTVPKMYTHKNTGYQSLLKRKPSIPPQDKRHFEGFSGKKQTSTANETKQKSEKKPPILADPPVEASEDEEDPAESVLRGTWVPGCPGRPPKAAKYLSAAKLAQIRARRASVPVGHKLAVAAAVVAQQKRASKRIEVLSEKEKPIELEPIESADDEVQQQQQLESMATSAAVRRGRSNLLQALKKQKRGPGRPSLASLAQKGPKRGPVPSVSKLVKHSSFSASSGSSPNSRSSTPTWGNTTRQQSEDSCDRRSSSTEYPPLLLLNDPGEPAIPTLSSIYEMGQDAFLRYFGLHTPEEAQALKERKRERKRRSCYSTERKDFHYGKLDYYEQQQRYVAYQAVRASRCTHQRPILYSPPVAVAKKRKQSTLPSAGSSSSSATARHQHHHHQRPQPANIFAAMDKRTCFVCFKSGTTDELGACMNCCNIYHLNCHTIDELSDAYRQRDDLCPVCLVSDDK
uniref:PHD-type domain-containing protein n=1 Tax=Anopheles maculatus TaxID=74869 RepID=A0A182T520_9DIPT